jgi:enoyl-CoA hydratase/carnithine racemase
METSVISEWERHGCIGVLTINNPPQNYLEGFQLALLEDLKRWTNDASLKGMIITGKGRHFCAGFDKEDLFKMTNRELLLEELRKNNAIPYYIEELPIPVVAAIAGVCFGAGLELALSCHIRVCSEKVLLSFPETGYGIIPGLNGAIRLPGKIGACRALEMVLAGKIINADEALELGIVDFVLPSKKVFDFSLSLLEKTVNKNSIDVIRSIMKSVNNTRKMPFEAATEKETEIFANLVFARHKMLQERN